MHMPLNIREEVCSTVTTSKVALKVEEEAMEALTTMILAMGAPNTILGLFHMVHMGIREVLIVAV